MNILRLSFDDNKKALIDAGKIKIKIKKVGFFNAYNYGGIRASCLIETMPDEFNRFFFTFEFSDFNNQGLPSNETCGILTGWEASAQSVPTRISKSIISPSALNYAGIRTNSFGYEFIDFVNNRNYFTQYGRPTQNLASIINSSPKFKSVDSIANLRDNDYYFDMEFPFNDAFSEKPYFSLINTTFRSEEGAFAFAVSYSKFISVQGSAQSFYQPSNKDTTLVSVGEDSIIAIGSKLCIMAKTNGQYGDTTEAALFKNIFDLGTETASEKAERQSQFRREYIGFNFEYAELDSSI